MSMVVRVCIKRIFGALLVFSSQVAWADDIYVAVASNFVGPAKELAELFHRETKHKVHLSSGATAKFFAQVVNGAPFEVLLAADQNHPRKLIDKGLADSGTLLTYAVGKLALWSPRKEFVDFQGKVLSESGFKHLSIANPDVAPYGVAAKEVLVKVGLWDRLQARIVKGENITQAYQFVASGNAELGFVSFSQIFLEGVPISGSYWIVPQTHYSPLKQDAVVLYKGRGKVAAKDFVKFLGTPGARAIIRRFGYDLP